MSISMYLCIYIYIYIYICYPYLPAVWRDECICRGQPDPARDAVPQHILPAVEPPQRGDGTHFGVVHRGAGGLRQEVYMYIYICVYVNICTYIHTHIYIYTHTHICI